MHAMSGISNIEASSSTKVPNWQLIADLEPRPRHRTSAHPQEHYALRRTTAGADADRDT